MQEASRTNLVEEEAKVGLLNGIVQVSILKDNVGTLAPKLKGDTLQIAGACCLLHQVANLGQNRCEMQQCHLIITTFFILENYFIINSH